MDTVQQQLGIQPGGTTGDYKFSLERVACFGACALAPVMVMDDTVYGKVTTTKVKKLMTEQQEE